MSSENFTPGPWCVKWKEYPVLFPFIYPECKGSAIVKMCGKLNDELAGTTLPAGRLSDYADPENVLANANLIAAAPEMYEELQRCCAVCKLQHPKMSGCKFCSTDKVLKKARGEA